MATVNLAAAGQAVATAEAALLRVIDLRAIMISPDSAESDISHNVSKAVSPFTGSEQGVALPGDKWVLTFNYKDLGPSYGRQFKAIKAMLRGGAEVAHIHDLSYIPRRLVEPGAPLINGANQAGTLLNVDGVTPNTTVYEFGDQISYLCSDGCFRMHMVTGPAVSDGLGQVKIPIMPPLRNPPVDNAAVNSVKPSITVTLMDSSAVSVSTVIHAASFTFLEYLFNMVA